MSEFYSNIARLPNMKFCIGPLANITAAPVHQCDRINTSKEEWGPTAASHTQYSTFHVLLRFTTISRKPTASQTEKKDNGANLLLSGLLPASVKYYKFCVWWKIGVHAWKRMSGLRHLLGRTGPLKCKLELLLQDRWVLIFKSWTKKIQNIKYLQFLDKVKR